VGTTIKRTINLKAVYFNSGKRKNFKAPIIQDVLEKFWTNSSSVADTLQPRGGDDNVRRCFINKGKSYEQGFGFQFCSYLPGEFPPSSSLDLSKKAVDVDAIPIVDEEGNHRQIISVVHVLAFGHALIVESVKGSGGIDVLERYLTRIVKQILDTPNHPAVHLVDPAPKGLHQLISHGGGVVGVDLLLAESNVIKGSKYASSLTTLRDQLPGTDKLFVKWQSSTILNVQEVEQAFSEAEQNDALDRVSVYLRNGDTVSLSKHRIRARPDVQSVNGKNPASNELMKEMRNFIIELKSPDEDDGLTILTEDGRLANVNI